MDSRSNRGDETTGSVGAILAGVRTAPCIRDRTRAVAWKGRWGEPASRRPQDVSTSGSFIFYENDLTSGWREYWPEKLSAIGRFFLLMDEVPLWMKCDRPHVLVLIPREGHDPSSYANSLCRPP